MPLLSITNDPNSEEARRVEAELDKKENFWKAVKWAAGVVLFIILLLIGYSIKNQI